MPTAFKRDAGWKRWRKALDPSRFKAHARKYLREAARRNGKDAEEVMRRAIQDGGYERNAELTVAIKGSEKPLFDKGSSLSQAITSIVVDDLTTFIGVPSKDSFYDVAVVLHEGRAIPVTDAMRGMFYMLWRASVGDPVTLSERAKQLFERNQDWLPLKKSTKAIVIPSRPFVRKAFEDPELHARARKNWEDAIAAAIKVQARG
jgi:hypothetical protein